MDSTDNESNVSYWDYSAQHNQLQEKYVQLNTEHQNRYTEIAEQVTSLKQMVEGSGSKREMLLVVESILTSVAENLTHLKDELHQHISEPFDDLPSDNSEEDDRSENNSPATAYRDYNRLKEQFNHLSDEYNVAFENNEDLLVKLDTHLKANAELTNNNRELKIFINNSEILRRKLHNTIQDLKGNVRVFCRMRPSFNSEENKQLLNGHYIDKNHFKVEISEELIKTFIEKVPANLEFSFEKIFDYNASQFEVFQNIAELLDSALDGYNVNIFCCGPKGSGKSYTILGGDTTEELGFLPRTIEYLFICLNAFRVAGWVYVLNGSLLEVHNETLRDLLNKSCTQNIEIYYKDKVPMVTNLSVHPVNNNFAQLVVNTIKTECKPRSHVICKINVFRQHQVAEKLQASSINFVKLAGYECPNIAREGIEDIENACKGYNALGRVLSGLFNKEQNIPYSDSKLTSALELTLNSSSKNIVIVHILPYEDHNNIKSLMFASKLKEKANDSTDTSS